MPDIAVLAQIVDLVTAWARSRSDVLGLAVVGSWARGMARPDSDIDLVLLVSDPQAFRSSELWLAELQWREGRVVAWRDAQYAAAWSRHVQLESNREIEFTLCGLQWAATRPVDPATAEVVSNGCRVVLDKPRLFENLLAVTSP